MTFKEHKGDIIDYIENSSDNLIVIHQANCFNTLHNARGIAGVLGKKYPQIAHADDAISKGDKSKLGSYTYAKVKDNIWIFNAYGQYNYGMDPNKVYTRYGHLRNSLGLIRTMCSIYMPNPVYLIPKYIGANLANGDHDRIMGILKEVFTEDDDVTLIYN